MIKEDLTKLNEIIDRLTQNRFFENYKEIRMFYEYLADKYNFDLRTHTIDPNTGAIVPIKDRDRVYFDEWQNRMRT